MASSSSQSIPVLLVARLDVPLHKGNQSFTPDPSMEVEEAKIWNSHVLIPFSISNNVHAFLVPFRDSSMNTKKVKDIFLGYPNCKPRVFS